MARRDQQQRVREAAQYDRVRLEHGHLLALVRARRDPYRSLRSPVTAERRALFLCAGRHRHVELEIADHRQTLRRGAELAQPLGIGGRLRGDEACVADRAAHQGADRTVAAQAARRQACIGDHDRNAVVLARHEQVRPDLGLHDHDDARPHAFEEPLDRRGQVVRQVDVEDAIAEQVLHAFGAGRRDRRDHEPGVGVAAHQRLDQRHRGIDLADRHGVDPDAVADAWIGKEAEPLAPALEVVRIAQAARRQPVQDHRRQQIHRERVEEALHGSEAFGGRRVYRLPPAVAAVARTRRGRGDRARTLSAAADRGDNRRG